MGVWIKRESQKAKQALSDHTGRQESTRFRVHCEPEDSQKIFYWQLLRVFEYAWQLLCCPID